MAPATISGTPAQSDVGNHDVMMEVTDGIAPPSCSRFQIAVQDVDNAPTIAPIPSRRRPKGTPFDLDLAPFVTDSDTAASRAHVRRDGRRCRPASTLSPPAGLTGTPQIGASVGTHTVRFTSRTRRTPCRANSARVVPAGRVDLARDDERGAEPRDARHARDVDARRHEPRADKSARRARRSRRCSRGDVPFRFDAPTTPGCTIDAVRQPNHARLHARAAGRRSVDDDHVDGPRQLRRRRVRGRDRRRRRAARSTRCRATTRLRRR